jgi:uncharacterized membrane protein
METGVEAVPRAGAIEILPITRADILACLAAGWRDLRTAPAFGLTIGALHAAGGWAAVAFATFTGLHYFTYPFLTGFALVAPFMASALYEVSRRLELGEPLTWRAVLRNVQAGGGRDLGWMCLVTLFSFILWIDYSFFLYLIFYGAHMPDPGAFLREVLTTPKGLAFILASNGVGAAIAFFVFSITVVSMPLLLDRDVDFVTAMVTSVRAVQKNPGALVFWAFIIAALLFLGLASALVGLIVVLPLLGHASWHVYRKLVKA